MNTKPGSVIKSKLTPTGDCYSCLLWLLDDCQGGHAYGCDKWIDIKGWVIRHRSQLHQLLDGGIQAPLV
jgi:hypothetical protein